jgi:hypothetical protein
MNRRSFLKGLFTAAVVVLAPFPNLQQKTILKSLTWEYNAIAKGKGASGAPRYIYCGRDFFQALEGELIALQRFSDAFVTPPIRTLVFKSVTVIPLGPGYWHEFIV